MAIEAGRVLSGRYRLVRPLGQGSQASVWVAEHLALSTHVAVKLIDPDLARKDDARERFKREATAAAQLRSAHVVQILDHGIDGTQPFIVMELLDGEDLYERLGKCGRLTLRQTSKMFTQVARALSRAHAAGIVHRDMKPENVFIVHNDDDEVVKVLDFGVAKITDPAKRTMQRTGVGTLIGTPHYMSPEQVKGIGEVDFRSDVWSLGVIAYQCVTGELPFDSEGVGDLLIRISIGDIPVPSKVVPSLPPAFDRWFATICDRDPDKRFASAREAASALARIAHGTADDAHGARHGSARPHRPSAAAPRPSSKPPKPVEGSTSKRTPDDHGEAAAPRAPAVPEGEERAPQGAMSDGGDIHVEEAPGSTLPPPSAATPSIAGGQPRATAAAPVASSAPLTTTAPTTQRFTAQPVRSVPRTTVSGLASSGLSITPPPELAGTRRKRLVTWLVAGTIAAIALIGWRVVGPYVRQPATGAVAGPALDVATQLAPTTSPWPSATEPGPAVDPGKPPDGKEPPAASAGSAKPKGRPAARRPRLADDPVIQYDLPPEE